MRSWVLSKSVIVTARLLRMTELPDCVVYSVSGRVPQIRIANEYSIAIFP